MLLDESSDNDLVLNRWTKTKSQIWWFCHTLTLTKGYDNLRLSTSMCKEGEDVKFALVVPESRCQQTLLPTIETPLLCSEPSWYCQGHAVTSIPDLYKQENMPVYNNG